MESAGKTIPKWKMQSLARSILAGTRRFYANPENVQRFETWRDSEKGRAYAVRHQQTEEGAYGYMAMADRRDAH